MSQKSENQIKSDNSIPQSQDSQKLSKQSLKQSQTKSINIMERNLLKMRTLTQKLIASNILEGHSQNIIDQLQQITLPSPQENYIHINETLEQSYKMQFFNDSFQIIQGQLEDRELLNAISLFLNNQQLFNQFYIYNEEQDTYIFKLYKKNIRYSILIDQFIPSLGHLPKYARSTNNTICISLIEKAMALLLGGYEQLKGISLRDSIRNLFGLDPEIIIYGSSENVNQKQLQIILNLLFENKSIIGFMYIGSAEFKKKNQTAFLPNINQIYVLKNIQDNNYVLYNYFNNEQNIISINDIINNFNCITIIKDQPDDFRGLSFNVTTTTHGVPGNNQQWINNPNYQMVINTQNESQFIFKLTELEDQDGITGMLLVNQRDVRTFNQNNVIFMTKQNIIQIGQRKQNYSCFSTKLKGFYTLFIFSTSKEPKQVLIEIYYQGRPSLIEFKFKSKQILEYCVGEPIDTEGIRILRDIIKDKDLICGNFKYQILINPSQAIQSKQYNDNQQVDNEIACILEDELQKELLALNLEGNEPIESDIFDFNDYQLTDEGFQLILIDLIAEPKIKELRLKNNNLHDESILNLCYELEKSYHQELEILDISQNLLTKKSNDVINTLRKKLKNLKTVYQ